MLCAGSGFVAEPQNPESVQDFCRKLVENRDVIKYLSIEYAGTDMQTDLIFTLARLTNLYHFDLIARPCVIEKNYLRIGIFESRDCLAFHEVAFCDHLILKDRRKRRETALELVKVLVDDLTSLVDENIEGLRVKVDEKELTRDMISESWRGKALINHEKHLFSKCSNSFIEKEVLKTMASEMVVEVTEEKPVCTDGKAQQVFVQAITSNCLESCSEIRELISSFSVDVPKQFIRNLGKLSGVVANEIGCKEPPERKCIFLVLMRFCFNELYPVNKYFKVQGQDVIAELSDRTLKEFDPPAKYYPAEIDVNGTPRQLRDDIHYRAAICHLERISFQTNPIDILNDVHMTMRAIERAASIYGDAGESMFPFEVSFGLFLLVTLASDIPEYINIAKFVQDYTIESYVPQSAQFALAIFTSCARHLTDLLGNA